MPRRPETNEAKAATGRAAYIYAAVGAILLSLAASASWGVSDFLGGLQARRMPGIVVVAGSQVVAGLILALFVLPFTGLETNAAWIALAGGVAGACGITALYSGLALGPMSIVASISSTAAAAPILFGIATGERPTALQGVGMVLAGVGVVIAAQDRPVSEELRIASRRAVLLALAAAVAFGASLILVERATRGSDPLTTVYWARVGTLSAIAIAIAVLRPPLASLRAAPRVTFAIGIADIGGVLLYATATTKGLLGITALLSSMYPVLTIVLAHTLLGERIRPMQAVGVASVLAGVALLSLSS